ncbi:MAG: porin, partial [Mesorhizobium sp.]
GKNFGAAVNVAYDIVPGLTVTAEVDYMHVGEDTVSNWTGATKENSLGGLIRFQRSF